VLVLFRRLVLRRRARAWTRYIPSADPKRALRWFAAWLLLVLVLHTLAMVAFEGLAPGDAAWLTLTTVTTVGYGDFSAETAAGRLSTAILIYFGGIFVLFQAAAVYFDYRAERRERMHQGRWRWNMRDHILVLNVPAENAVSYLVRLVREFRASRRFRDRPVQVVTSKFEDGLPEPLHGLGVVHYCGEAWDPQALAAAEARAASVIVVLSRSDTDPASDGRTFDIVDRLREAGVEGRILAECVEDANRERLRRAGAEIVVRPLRGYPEMIVRALAAPGAETILEDLFTSRGDECWRYDVDVEGRRWADVVRLLVERDVGVPVGYRRAADRQLRINPPPDDVVRADKLYVLVREGNARPDEEIATILR
jgi:voltage-gated potassium channel